MSPPEGARPPLPTREVDKYRQQLGGALEQLEARRSLLGMIDADEDVAAGEVQLAVREYGDARRVLETIKPSTELRATHDLLIASCTLGAMAFNLRTPAGQNSSPDARQNAASAAAGSLMMFARACADLGCPVPPR